MRLIELEIERLPGVEPGFALRELSPGVTVVVGPNASGKSSLVRALRALWRLDDDGHAEVRVAGAFEQTREDGSVARWRAERRGPLAAWECDGAPADAPPPPPPHLLDSYLIDIESLVLEGDTDAAIGDRLHREMSGGYDLDEARRAALLPREGHVAAGRKLKEARKQVADLERRHADLWRRLERRDALQAEFEENRREAEAKVRYETAKELHGKLAELRAVRSRLALQPAALERLTGDEAERLRQLEQELETAKELAEAAEGRLRTAREELEGSGLQGSPLTAHAAAGLRRRAESLAKIHTRVEELEALLGRSRGALAAPWLRLGGGSAGVGPQALADGTLEKVELLLGDRLAAATAAKGAESELERLELERARLAEGEEADGEPDDPRLNRAESALADWLAAPATRPRRLPALLLVVGALLFVLAALLALGGASVAGVADGAAHFAGAVGDAPALLLVTLAGGVLLLLGTWLALRPGSPSGARAAADAYLRTGARPPAAWEPGAVASRLEELLAVGARRREDARRLASLEGRIGAARTAQREATAERQRAEAELTELSRLTGYDAARGEGARTGAGFTVWLHAVRQAREELERQNGIREERRALERQADGYFAELLAGLRDTPLAPSGWPTEPARLVEGRWVGSKHASADELLQRCDRLERLLAQREQARRDERLAREALEAARGRAEAAARQRRELLERLDIAADAPDARAQLENLLGRLETWRSDRDARNQLEAVVGNYEATLAAHPDVLELARGGDVDALEAAIRRCAAAAEERDDLNQRIGALTEAVKLARTERHLERARAERQQRADEVEQHLYRARLNALTDTLFDDVESDHQAIHQPELLQRAKGWFARFTRHAFELEFVPTAARAERLMARDVSQARTLRPRQLSTGTRAQLLLALRVAHAACAEKGATRLPFFLDEALTTADGDRFAEVAQSLLQLAREDGRQLFYLSARGEDAAAWRRLAGDAPQLVKVIDLAQVRRLGNAARLPLTAFPEPTPLPEPGAMSAEEYARALGVPPVDPWREPSAVHALYLLGDELELVHRLVRSGLHSAGQLHELLAADGARLLPLEPHEEALLSRRLAGLEAWCAAWREGRNRPVDVAALQESGAITETFMPRLVELADEVGNDPRALVEALRDKRVARFRADAIDDLDEWFEERGYLGARPPLARSSRILVTAQALARASGADDGAHAEAGRLVERLEAAVQSEKEPA